MRIKSRIKVFLRVIFVLAVIFGATAAVINIIVYESAKDKIYTADEYKFTDKADCILVLGAGVREDGSPSNMLEDRLITGIRLYESGASDVLLMSGDHGSEDYDEVGAMLDYAVNDGVDKEKIFLDHAGFSTYESLYRAKEIFGAEKIVIVTQKYHLYRALYLAEALGLDAVGVQADLRTYIGQSMRETREIAARVKDFAYAVFKPEPTYLGESISLEESGTVTQE